MIVKGWANLVTVNFAHAGNGWYVSNQLERTTGSLLYVDRSGNATALNAPPSFVPMWATPSPDGRHLAFTSYPGIQNATYPNLPLPQMAPGAAMCDSSLLQGFYVSGIMAGLADGSVRMVSSGVSQYSWNLAFNPADGQTFDNSW